MTRLNPEGHDESQYLKAVFNPVSGKMEMPPIINAFRAAKGDIIRNEDDKLESVHWLPRILERQGNITKEHLDTAKAFERYLIHAWRTMGICDLRGKLNDILPASGLDDNTDMFLEIARKVVRPELNRVIWTVMKNFPCSSAVLPSHDLGVLKHGLENIQKVIDEHKERRNNATSTPPEVSLNTNRSEII
jgi:hypothetical protein